MKIFCHLTLIIVILRIYYVIDCKRIYKSIVIFLHAAYYIFMHYYVNENMVRFIVSPERNEGFEKTKTSLFQCLYFSNLICLCTVKMKAWS